MPDQPALPEWWEAGEAIEAVLAQDRAVDDDPRAQAVRWRERSGLPVVAAVIEQALAYAATGRAHPGMWETADEAARRERAEAVIAASADAVEAYEVAHADSHTGSWYEWKDNQPTFVVAFADDLVRHADALRYPGVRVTERPRSELPAIIEDLLAAEPPAGAIWWHIALDEGETVIELKGTGPDEAAAAAWLAQRYGDRVRLSWEACEAVRPVSWQVWEASSADPRVLSVRWQSNTAYTFDRVECEEGLDAVRITIFESQFKGQTTMMGAYRSAEVRLREPIGTRRVIDAVTDRPRRRVD